MPPADRIDAQAIAEHHDFLSSLARGLLGSSHLAEDAVQDTWLAVLDRPRPKHLRAYLAKVLRHGSGRVWSREAGRRGAERSVARDEGVDPGLEERFAVKEELAKATLSLPEAQRRALFLRFAEDRTPAEISRLTGEPVGTIKTRLVRALKALRGELDERHAGGRAEWLAAMAPLGALSGVGSAGAVASTGSRAVLAIGASLVALPLLAAAIWFAGQRPSEPRVAMDLAALEPWAPDPELAEAGSPSGAESQQSGQQAAPGSAPLAEARSVAGSGEPGTGNLTVQFISRDGKPIRGVLARAESSAGSDELLLEYGERPRIDPIEVRTDAKGRARLEIPPIPCLDWTLTAAAEGYGTVSLRLSPSPPGAAVDLGSVVMPPSCTLTLRVLEPDGEPVRFPMEALFCCTDDWRSRVVQKSGHFADLSEGAAVLTGIGPGNYNVTLWTEGLSTRASQTVEVLEGQANELTVQLADKAQAPGLLVSIRNLYGVRPDVRRLKLLDGDGNRIPADEIDEESGTKRWLGLADEARTLSLLDGGWEPWSKEVTRGTGSVWVRAVPTSGVRILGLGAGPGSSGPRVSIAHVIEKSRTSQWLDPLYLHREPRPADGVFRLPPGKHWLRLLGPGVVPQDLWLEGLKSGEVRSVTVRLQEQRTFAGQVLEASGRPIAGAIVQLLLPAQEGDGPGSMVRPVRTFGSDGPQYRHEIACGYTDEQGRYELHCQDEGAILLRVWRPHVPEVGASEWLTERRKTTDALGVAELLMAAGEEGVAREIRLPALGRVSVQLAAGDWSPFEFALAPGEEASGLGSSVRVASLPMVQPWDGGRLEFANVRQGTYALVAVHGRQPSRGDLSPRRREVLLWLEVGEGQDLFLDCDPALVLPKALPLNVALTGAPSGPVRILVQQLKDGKPTQAGPIHTSIHGSGTIPLWVGTEGHIRVALSGAGGGWLVAEDFELAPERESLEVAIDLVEGELQLMRGDGQPLNDYTLRPHLPPGINTDWTTDQHHPQTDAEGRVRAVHPRGERRFVGFHWKRPVGPISWPPAPDTVLVVR